MSAWLKGLVGLVVLTLVLAVIVAATLPAATAYRHAESHLAPLRLQGIDGTLWRGQARQASVFAVPLGALRWTLSPAAALRLHAQGDVDLSGRDVTLHTRFDASREAIALTDLTTRWPASVLSPALDIPSLVLLGQADVTASTLVLRDGFIDAVEGQLVWRQAGVSGAAEARFPDLTLTFTTPSPGIVEGRLHDGGGALAATGTVRLVRNQFHAEIRLNVRGDQPQLAEALRYVGERLPDGGSLLRIDGTLQPVF